MTDAGILLGLPRAQAHDLIVQSAVGAAVMLRDSGEHPVKLREAVTSPAGTTINAIRELENHGVRSALIAALEAARDRSRELASGTNYLVWRGGPGPRPAPVRPRRPAERGLRLPPVAEPPYDARAPAGPPYRSDGQAPADQGQPTPAEHARHPDRRSGNGGADRLKNGVAALPFTLATEAPAEDKAAEERSAASAALATSATSAAPVGARPAGPLLKRPLEPSLEPSAPTGARPASRASAAAELFARADQTAAARCRITPRRTAYPGEPAPLPQPRLKTGHRTRGARGVRAPTRVSPRIRTRAYALEFAPGLPIHRLDDPKPQLCDMPIAAFGIRGPWACYRPYDEEDGDGCGYTEKRRPHACQARARAGP